MNVELRKEKPEDLSFICIISLVSGFIYVIFFIQPMMAKTSWISTLYNFFNIRSICLNKIQIRFSASFEFLRNLLYRYLLLSPYLRALLMFAVCKHMDLLLWRYSFSQHERSESLERKKKIMWANQSDCNEFFKIMSG